MARPAHEPHPVRRAAARIGRAIVFAAASVVVATPAAAQGFDIRSLIPDEGPRERAEREKQQREGEQRRVCDRVRGWFDEGPLHLTPGHITPAEQNAAVQLLLDDGRFRRAFGKPLAQMSSGELSRLTSETVPRCIDPKTAPSSYYFDVRSVAYAALDPQRQSTTLRQLNATRNAASSLQAMTDELQALPVTEQGYARLGLIRAYGEAPMRTADRSTVTEYEVALASAEARVGAPMQTALVRDAIAASIGHEGLAQLARLAAELQRRGPNSVTLRENLLQINVRMEQIASSMLAAERARIDGLGDGMAGLERGVRWQATYDVRFRPYAALARTLDDIESYFLLQRKGVLNGAQSEFASLARRAITEEQLDTLQRRFLLASDESTPTGTQLLQVLVDQRHEIGTHGAPVAAGRDLERGELAPPEFVNVGATVDGGSLPISPEAPVRARQPAGALVPVDLSGEPAEDVMLDLVRTRYQNELERLRRLSVRCPSGRASDNAACGANSNAAGAMAEEPFKITRFRKRGCASVSGRVGYVCEFEYAVAGGPNRIVSTITQNLGGDDGIASARFAPRDGDWVMITAH